MTARAVTFRTEAKNFFWTDDAGGWAGWDRFFIPSLSTKVGTVLLMATRRGLEHRCRRSLLEALAILENPHWKDVYAKYVRGPLGRAECFPTNDAQHGAELLRRALCEIDLEL
jgi:hypothetical protein